MGIRIKDEAKKKLKKKKKTKIRKSVFKNQLWQFTILGVIQLTQSKGGKSRDVHGPVGWRCNRVKVLKLQFPRTPEPLWLPPSWFLTSLEFSNIQQTNLHLACMSWFLFLATLKHLTKKGPQVEKRSDLLCVTSEGKRLEKTESSMRHISGI